MEFKEKHYKTMGAPVIEYGCIEQQIVDKYITKTFTYKELGKIIVQENGWNSKLIPKFLNICFYELINEEMWHILKDFKNPKIDFKYLNRLVTTKVKELHPEIF